MYELIKSSFQAYASAAAFSGLWILLATIIPPSIALAFATIQKEKNKTRITTSDNDFVVTVPNVFLTVGALGSAMFSAVVLAFTFLSDDYPHWLFYAIFGLFIWLSVYLMVKTLTFRVVVKGESITVHSAFKKPYSFVCDEIVSAVRQTKNNKVKSERIVVKTVHAKKFVVESSEIAYEHFARKMQRSVKKDCLVGF